MLALMLIASLSQASDFYECTVQAELTRIEPINETIVRADLEVVATAGGRCASGSHPEARIPLPAGSDPAALAPGTQVLLYLQHSDGVTAAGPSSTDSWLLLGVVADAPDPLCALEAEVVANCTKPGCDWLDVLPTSPTTTLGCPARGVRTRLAAITPASIEALAQGDRVRGKRDGPHGSWTLTRIEPVER
jgi:hypothetical protein